MITASGIISSLLPSFVVLEEAKDQQSASLHLVLLDLQLK